MIRIARRYRWLAASAVALVTALLPEVAAAHGPATPDTDGKVSKQEAVHLPGVAMRWQALDRNNDGALNRDEFIAGFRT